jgi:hypothetical protein
MNAVYVMRSENGLVKIGRSRNPEKRRKALQATSGFPVELIHHWPSEAPSTVERAAHLLLSEHRKAGEWFDVSVEDAVAAIENAVQQLHECGGSMKFPRSGIAVSMRLSADLMARLDQWRMAQTPPLSRTAVIIMGVEWLISTCPPKGRAK